MAYSAGADLCCVLFVGLVCKDEAEHAVLMFTINLGHLESPYVLGGSCHAMDYLSDYKYIVGLPFWQEDNLKNIAGGFSVGGDIYGVEEIKKLSFCTEKSPGFCLFC